MKKQIITLFTLLLFATVSYAQELNSRIKAASSGETNPPTGITKNDIPRITTQERLNNFSSFKAGEIVYDTNLEAHYQYMGDSTWILSDKFSPKKSSSYLAQLSTLSSFSGVPSLNAIAPGVAAGQVAFYTDSNTTNGSNNLFWNNSNNRLGIRKTNPNYPLDVAGQIYADSLNINGIYIGRGRGGDVSNTAVGSNALSNNTTGFYNSASGSYALYSNRDGNNNTASGSAALYSNTGGSNNTASGSAALYSNRDGNNNTASGSAALHLNTTGNNNTATGSAALHSNISGENNTASGSAALHSNISGENNTASGSAALHLNTTGNNNTASGSYALHLNNTGNNNTASGSYALFYNRTGSSNIALGDNSGYNLISGDKNIVIGSQVGFPDTSVSNQLVLANSIYGKNIYDSTATRIGIGTSSPTATLDINGSLRVRGGSPAAGKVLTSDANGNASWQEANASWQGANATVNDGDYAILDFPGFRFRQIRTARIAYNGTYNYLTEQGISVENIGGNQFAFKFNGTKYEMQIFTNIGGTGNYSGNIIFTLAPTNSSPNEYWRSLPTITNVPMTIYSTVWGTSFNTEWKTIYVQPNVQYSLFFTDFIGNTMKTDKIRIYFKKIN